MAFEARKLLSNHLRHAESHNKIKEEREMWQQRETEKKRERFCDDWSFRASMNITPLVRGRLISDDFHYSPSTSPTPPSSASQSPAPSSPSHKPRLSSSTHSHSANYWTRQLMKAEEADPFRWGHSGYKEQHPQEFVSSSSENEEAKGRKRDKEKKVKKRSKHKLKRKRKVVESEEEGEGKEIKKQKKRKRKRAVSTSSLSSDNNCHRSRSSSQKRKPRKKKRAKK